MASDNKPRVRVPASAKKGEIVEIKTLINHPMETGIRKDPKTGQTIPRLLINRFVATFNGKDVFSADLHTAVSANPFISFFFRASESGTFEIAWTDDNGKTVKASATMTVS
jgi:sulfur-oxidizing protein SoxZ